MTSRNRGKNVSRKNNEVRNKRKEAKYNIKKYIKNFIKLFTPFIYSFLLLFIYINDDETSSKILLLYSASFTVAMEIDAWIQYFYIKTGKLTLIYKINNFLKPILYFLFLFIGITFFLKKIELLDKIKHINKISIFIMFVSTVSYGIRDIKTYKLQELSKIKDINKN